MAGAVNLPFNSVSVPQQLQQARNPPATRPANKAQQTALTAEITANKRNDALLELAFHQIINYYHQAINNLPPTLFVRVHITLARRH
ncbi:MAG: hypothetical protein H6668_19985 [Ardenticatenaceae bacterium]|nr:hypothetical protein [Ardenticatenaceae bacterium]